MNDTIFSQELKTRMKQCMTEAAFLLWFQNYFEKEITDTINIVFNKTMRIRYTVLGDDYTCN